MSGLLPDVDPDGLLEYSVVFTDRSLNHMSKRFQRVMCDISGILKHVYNARSAVVVPGGGTYGMQAVARQFATDKKCLVIRNGWFSYRWTQIFEAGKIPAKSTVLKARRVGVGKQAPFAPAPMTKLSPRSAKFGRTWCSRRTSRPPRESCSPMRICAPSAMPSTRQVGCLSFLPRRVRARCGSTWRPAASTC